MCKPLEVLVCPSGNKTRPFCLHANPQLALSHLGGLHILRDGVCELLHRLSDWQRADVTALAHRASDRVGGDLVLTNDCEHWHLLLVCNLNLLADGTTTLVDLRANTKGGGLLEHLLTVGAEVITHRQHAELHRREPEGEVSRRGLKQHPEEALNRAKDGAVQHDPH